MSETTSRTPIEHALNHRLQRLHERITALDKAAAKTARYGDLQVAGTLLKTYAAQIDGRPTSVTLPDYRTPDAEMVITLDTSLTVIANAEDYFHRYRKAKRGRDTVLARIAAAQEEVTQREGQLAQLSDLDEDALSDLMTALHADGVLKDKPKPRVVVPAHPRRFYTTDHVLVEVGKNDRQNDHLTLTAPRENHWLHVRDLPGSHVVLHSAHPSDRDVQEAAMLAAYYSKGRGGRNVPVDLLRCSQLQKPKGAKPGLVTFSGRARTVTVTPTEELAAKLLAPGEHLGQD